MLDSKSFPFPEISDDDISWAAIQLGLKPVAFFGPESDDPRKLILQSSVSLDVAACPGSGKTTVLVAKLAILARKWQHRTCGICVLSHTNVARREIEEHLGHSTEARGLLSYPHYIGTIHGFVNEYLAIPWLTAQGYPIKTVDTDACEARRWRKLHKSRQEKLARKYIQQGDLRLVNTDFGFEKRRGNFPYRDDVPLCNLIKAAFRNTALEGHHCFDDMFVWARDMLVRFPAIRESIRCRFPVLFIDEAQDNSDEQSDLLRNIFSSQKASLVRQRFGDGNQAIYDFTGAQEATSDTFPDKSITMSIPDSFRFGQQIANLSDPLGLVPYSMTGRGPRHAIPSAQFDDRHTIFVFDEDSIGVVLSAYGDLLLDCFEDSELRGKTFAAIGMVHKKKEDESSTVCPQRVSDYWVDYEPKRSSLVYTPGSFLGFVRMGVKQSMRSGETSFAIETIAQGIIRLIKLSEGSPSENRTITRHRDVIQVLAEFPELKTRYINFLVSFGVKREVIGRAQWELTHRTTVLRVAECLCGESMEGNEVDEFLSWEDPVEAIPDATVPTAHIGNFYKHINGERQVEIKVASIHSVKGQTHTATLVLDTSWNGCNLEKLMPWLKGLSIGKGKKSGVQELTRLKTHYVAMTRPSHLLCLAIHKNALSDGNGATDVVGQQHLIGQGWKIVHVLPPPA